MAVDQDPPELTITLLGEKKKKKKIKGTPCKISIESTSTPGTAAH